jgi:hypothetical protein
MLNAVADNVLLISPSKWNALGKSPNLHSAIAVKLASQFFNSA